MTGASGFVGAAVTRRLLAAGHEVRALVRSASPRANLEGLDLEVAIGDLRDRRSLDAAVAGCSAVFHVAADYRLWARRPADLYESNVDGSLNVVGAAADAGVQRIVYTSSVATLGLRPDAPGDEETAVCLEDMVGDYKRSKFLAEHRLLALAREEGLPVVIVNPSTPIGPRDIKPTPTGRVIVQAASGRMPAYVDTGLNLVHVDDVADGHLRAFQCGEIGERYILGGENWTLRSLLEEVALVTGGSPPRVRLPHLLVLPLAFGCEWWHRVAGSPGEPMVCVDSVKMSRKRMFFSSDKAMARLGYAPRSARLAIADAIAWFTEQGYC